MRSDTPKAHDLIYDIGMHKGEDTEFYLRKGFRVVAFEADPDLASHCRTRLRDFIDQGRLVIVEGAIVDREAADAGLKKTRFYKSDTVSVWGTVRSDWAERNMKFGTSSKSIEVDTVDFGEVIQKYGVPHYMKIDIEGLDLVCVKAMEQFSVPPDFISLESSKTRFADIQREIEVLEKLGYNAFQAVEQSAVPASQPPWPATEGEYVSQKFQEGSSGLFGSELGGEWKSKGAVLRQYRFIRLGYYLLGDSGVLNRWRFRGAERLRLVVSRLLRFFTKASIPGWYDTHARHRTANQLKGGSQRTSLEGTLSAVRR